MPDDDERLLALFEFSAIFLILCDTAFVVVSGW
jgi:hypothetical protein